MRFEYELSRSIDPSDQVPNMTCRAYEIRGVMPATSIYRVRDFCTSLMVIPGVYSLAIRNADGGDWRDFGPVDTRNPEAAAAAKRPKRSRKAVRS